MASRRYAIPAGTTRCEETIEHSRFVTTIAYTPDRDAAHAFIQSVRDDFPDATHHCWAFVVGPPGTTADNGASDDGEPAGTAGRPMLHVLTNSDVGDVAAVVTRYFGGVKLGRGGLVRAYSAGVQRALREMARAEHVPRIRLTVAVDYEWVDAVRRLFEQHGAEIESQRFDVAAAFDIVVARDLAGDLRAALVETTRGGAKIDARA